ncbi:MAG: substrate-binding domain-containing protein [Anaerolineae bacterium]|nr:substrate-binding domain-containing protein [Anaerolineae bacterium]
MRKFLMTFIVMLMMAALTVTVTAQDERWDGADDLDVAPLQCGMGDEMDESDEGMDGDDEGMDEDMGMEYDGGSAMGAPDMMGEDIVLVDVPKLIGIGYFDATYLGMQQAAEELGNVTVIQGGTTEANIDDQVADIANYIAGGEIDGILFAANDPVAISPVLEDALSQGLHVIGYDANSTPGAREWFVNQAEFNGIAKGMIDSLVAEKGEDASFGIVTSTFTTPNQARWIAEMWAYASDCYPELEWLETLEAQEDAVLSFNQANSLINKYGEDLDGIFGMTSVATPSSADAVTQAGLCGEVAVVGLATPNAMKPYVDDGCVQSVVLWNPIDLGYAAVYVARAVVDGEFAPGDTTVEAGRLGTLTVVNGSEVLLGPPFIFNAENINDFDF